MSKSILSPKLTLSTKGCYYTYSDKESDWDFCADIIRDYFEVPKSAKQIQFCAFDEPGPGRTKIKFEHYDNVTWSGVSIDGDGDYKYIFSETQDAIKKLAGRRKIWYVDVYYWE